MSRLTASPTRQWGPLRTPHHPQAKRSAAVKSSPTGPRAARREAVPLDSRAKRSYPQQPTPRSPQPWVEIPRRSIKESETPHLGKRADARTLRARRAVGRHDHGLEKQH